MEPSTHGLIYHDMNIEKKAKLYGNTQNETTSPIQPLIDQSNNPNLHILSRKSTYTNNYHRGVDKPKKYRHTI
jgi:hypothetical protein